MLSERDASCASDGEIEEKRKINLGRVAAQLKGHRSSAEEKLLVPVSCRGLRRATQPCLLSFTVQAGC